MATPSSLPRTVFNQRLYKAIHRLWFADMPANMTVPNDEVRKKWFGLDATPDQKAAFDQECREVGGPALDILGPIKYPLPPFQSFEVDRQLASSFSAPIRQLITDPKSSDDQDAGPALSKYDITVALFVLLDQIPRNIFRQQQAVIYNHYDRISRALAHCVVLPPETTGVDEIYKVDEQSPTGGRVPTRETWMYMPLMHSENLSDHDIFSAQCSRLVELLRKGGDEEAAKSIEMAGPFEEKHRIPLERFGRYPHRNKVLGREMTAEEKKFLEDGGETFGTG